MNEVKQKAAQEVVEVARLLASDESTPAWTGVMPSWMTRTEKIGMLWNALRRYDLIHTETEYTAHSSKPFADERAKVGDVVMHKHTSTGLHMCAIEGVHLTVEEATDRYVSVRGDGVRSKWIRIDHGWYEIVKRAEEKRFPKVGEFWRNKTTGVVKRIAAEAGMTAVGIGAGVDIWIMHDRDWWREDDMEFVFPARTDGEFKAGDRVTFCDREWIATPDPMQRVNDGGLYLRIHLPPDAKESKPGQWCPQAYAPIDMVTLKVPVEMRQKGDEFRAYR